MRVEPRWLRSGQPVARVVSPFGSESEQFGARLMTYSYTQISHYLTCPRSYRHRYLDGWREKGTHANMLFGRVFEKALAALFLRQDPGAVLFQEWSAHQNGLIEYSRNDSWDHML